ncbi:MAG: hypothetical protein ACRC1K_04265, partial [Planctomycetia bacterium]
MDKRLFTFWAVALVIFIGWNQLMMILYPPKPRPPAAKAPLAAAVDPATPDAAAAAKNAPVLKDGEKPAAAPAGPPAEAPPPAVETGISLGVEQTGDDPEYRIFALLSNRGASIQTLRLNDYKNEYRSGPLVLLREETPGVSSYLLAVDGASTVPLDQKVWDVV